MEKPRGNQKDAERRRKTQKNARKRRKAQKVAERHRKIQQVTEQKSRGKKIDLTDQQDAASVREKTQTQRG